MARYTGNDGVVLEGANVLGNLREWELSITGDEIEVPAMGDTARQRLAGKPDVGGSLTVWYDDADTAQGNLLQGVSVALELRPRGTGSGLPEFTLAVARITGENVRGAVDAGLEVQYTFVSDDLPSRTAQV